MQAYRSSFASVYNQRWSGFARMVAPRIQEVYENKFCGQANKTLLDLCCGTGHLALHFLEQGYRVTGIDLSESMLELARQSTESYIHSGQATFIHGDARFFTLENPVGLAVSTFDALNHLDSFQDLQSCFRCVFSALAEKGVFIFDLNTRLGLMRYWNNITVEDSDEFTLIDRGIFDGQSERAYTRITGFSRLEDGHFERFEETVYNTVFEMQAVKEELVNTGFSQVVLARIQDLNASIDDPENHSRVFFIAEK